MQTILRFFHDEQGSAAIGHAAITGMVTMVLFTALVSMGTRFLMMVASS